MTKKQTRYSMALAAVVLAAYFFAPTPAASPKLLQSYNEATALPWTGPSHDRVWDHHLTLSDGTAVHIAARGGMGGTIQITYGVAENHLIYRYQDYIYPNDLRISADQHFLFATVAGLEGGIWPKSFIYEFDLQARSLVSKRRLPRP